MGVAASAMLHRFDTHMLEEVLIRCDLKTLARVKQTSDHLCSLVNALSPNGRLWSTQWRKTAMGVARSESTFQQMCTKMTTLDVTGRWSVDGEYSTGEPYSYFMELRATEPEGDCSKPLEQWLVGEVTEPWPFKITGKRTRNGVIFQQNAGL